MEASGSIGPMDLLKAQLAPRPVIVRDESGRLFLEAVLQRASPLHRPL